MKSKVIATVLFVISSISLLTCFIALRAYFTDYKKGSSNEAGAADILMGIKGLFIISAVFFFVGRTFWRKWKHERLFKQERTSLNLKLIIMLKKRCSLQSLLLSTFAVIFFTGAPACSSAQNNKGPITEKEVKNYFTDWWTHSCKTEDECAVTFDSPVRVAAQTRHTFQLAGTYTCYPVKVDFTTRSLYPNSVYKLMHITHAVYYFYRNSFGDWEMGKEGERTTEEMVNKFAAKSTSKYPKPDFSAMLPWYEVVNYEYPKPGGDKMIIYFKPKTKERPLFFQMEFRDKNGALVGFQIPMCCSTELGGTEIGAVGKQTTYVPAESEMARVVSAKVVVPH